MKSVSVTGGNGFVGQRLLGKIKELQYDLVFPNEGNFINLINWELVKTIPPSDVIVHLAGKSFIPDSFNAPREFYVNNILSTINLLELARLNNSKFIFFSTYVYGSPQYLPIDELHPSNPLNPYTQTKLACEDIVRGYSRDFGLETIIFRPFNIYGNGQRKSFIIPSIIDKINSGKIELNDPRPSRDFVHVDDVVSAIISSLEFESAVKSITFNIGTGKSTSVSDLVDLIINVKKADTKISFTNSYRKGEILDTVANIDKIRFNLHWEPKVSLLEGITKLCIF